MKIKIIEHSSCRKLEKSVNKWIENNSIEIFFSYISIGSLGGFPSYVICITYKEKD